MPNKYHLSLRRGQEGSKRRQKTNFHSKMEKLLAILQMGLGEWYFIGIIGLCHFGHIRLAGLQNGRPRRSFD